MTKGAIALVAVAATAACGDMPTTIADASATPSLSVTSAITYGRVGIQGTPSDARYFIGDTIPLRAVFRNPSNVVVASPNDVVWVSRDTNKLRVDQNGRVIAVGTGSVSIQVSGGGVSAATTARVVAAPRLIISAPDTLTVGKPAVPASAVMKDATGKVVAQKFTWQSGATSVLTVGANGALTPVAPGTATLTVTGGGLTASKSIVVLRAPLAPVPTPVAPADGATAGDAPSRVGTGVGKTAGGADSIALQVVRFAPATPTLVPVTTAAAPVLVANGVPLRAGLLRPGQEARVQVLLAGRPVEAYVEILKGRHRDGSARFVLVQFPATAGGAPLAAALLIHPSTAPAAPRRAKVALTTALPAAAALPTSPDYLIATELLGAPTLSVAATNALGATYQRYNADFVTQSARQTLPQITAFETGGNYYDRALNHYAYWVRSGNPQYFALAAGVADKYRRWLESGLRDAHHSQLEGLALTYWLLGDERARTVAELQADQVYRSYGTRLGAGDRYNEGRIAARAVMGAVLSWQLEGTKRNWAADARQVLTRALTNQDATGRWGGKFCGGELNYMTGQFNSAAIYYYRHFEADARIPTYIARANDYLWRTQWLPASRSFKYWDAPTPGATCEDGKSDDDAAVDLNMLFVWSFAWQAQRTNDPVARGRAAQIFGAAVEKAYIRGDKQYNQQYYNSYLALPVLR